MVFTDCIVRIGTRVIAFYSRERIYVKERLGMTHNVVVILVFGVSGAHEDVHTGRRAAANGDGDDPAKLINRYSISYYFVITTARRSR